MAENRQRQVLVLAPHPDDETFGCGGTIRMLSESGVAVDVAFMTRGELGFEGGTEITAEAQSQLAEVRMREGLAACDALGARQALFLDGRDTHLAQQPQLARSIADLIQRTAYQRVFCPWPGDSHEDHQATFRWLRQAVADIQGAHGAPATSHFWLYEVWKPLPANTFVPIDNTIDAKRRAIQQYRSQLAQLNYAEGFIGLASYRSLFCPASRYAEAFLVCDHREILTLA